MTTRRRTKGGDASHAVRPVQSVANHSAVGVGRAYPESRGAKPRPTLAEDMLALVKELRRDAREAWLSSGPWLTMLGEEYLRIARRIRQIVAKHKESK